MPDPQKTDAYILSKMADNGVIEVQAGGARAASMERLVESGLVAALPGQTHRFALTDAGRRARDDRKR